MSTRERETETETERKYIFCVMSNALFQSNGLHLYSKIGWIRIYREVGSGSGTSQSGYGAPFIYDGGCVIFFVINIPQIQIRIRTLIFFQEQITKMEDSLICIIPPLVFFILYYLHNTTVGILYSVVSAKYHCKASLFCIICTKPP